jgi:hypothetical protein
VSLRAPISISKNRPKRLNLSPAPAEFNLSVKKKVRLLGYAVTCTEFGFGGGNHTFIYDYILLRCDTVLLGK